MRSDGLPQRGKWGVPQPLAGLEHIVRIAAALYGDQRNVHSAVRKDGVAYVWGAVDAAKACRTHLTPVRLRLPRDCQAVKIVHGRHHTLMLDAAGRVYSWGANNRGQLGIGRPLMRRACITLPNVDNSDEELFVPLTGLPQIVDIAVGSHQSVALSIDGQVCFFMFSMIFFFFFLLLLIFSTVFSPLVEGLSLGYGARRICYGQRFCESC